MFNGLTAYGNDIIYNINYGIMANTIKSNYLLNNGCDTISSLIENKVANSFSIFPNPATSELNIQFDKNSSGEIIISNLIGGKILISKFVSHYNIVLVINHIPSGIFLLSLKYTNGISDSTIFIKQ